MNSVFKEIISALDGSALTKRYEHFIEVLKDDAIPPSVFDPLKPSLIEELKLTREVSEYLQKKKNDDVKKAQSEKAAETSIETPKEDPETVENKE